MHQELLRQVRRTLAEAGALDGVPSALVAVSGGVDSSVLLHLACALREKGGPELTAVHVHHGVRGSEADRDAEASERLAKLHGTEFHVVRLRPGKGRSAAEHELRSLRYEALERVARRTGATRILLGHQRDDQAETVLFRLLGGSDLRGLGAMRVFRPPLWVRPLLQIPRRDLLAEAIGCGIPYVEDSTNRSLDRRRNLLRHELLPWIRASLNPRVDEHLTGLAESMRFARDYLEEVAGGLIESARSGPGRFRVAPLREAPPAVRRAALQLMFGAAAGSGAALRRPQLRTVEHLVLTDGPLRRTPLPRGVTAVRAGERLRWVRND